MHHLADLFCELELPGKAEELLKGGIEDLKNRGKQRSKAFRRLLLPWAEACIKQHRFEKAGTAFLQLSDIFDEMVGPNVSDQLDHARSILGLVRIAYHESRWPEALESSEKAFFLMQKYKPFSDGNFYIGVILLFRTVIHFELGQLLESRKAFARAKICDQGPRHFIPGMGTYVLQPLRSRAESLNQLVNTVHKKRRMDLVWRIENEGTLQSKIDLMKSSS
jgi:tetratricopeptide (TPR) repeat protein